MKPDEVINQYGLERLEPHSQLSYDRKAFAIRLSVDSGCPPRPALFRRIADKIVPGFFEWHEWTNRVIYACCRRRWIGIAGCSGAAKTRNVAGFAATWWLCAPECSSVIFCSTTMKSMRKRGWSEIQSYFNAIGGGYGNFVDSRTVWQYRAGDDRNAIFGIAVNEGDTNKAAANIQGIHTKRQMVVIDEAEAVPAAIWKACTNLYSYPVDAGGEFILVALANPRYRLSQFGRFIEPDGGWDSVSIETDEWESKPQMDGKKALVVRLDFRKSPNVIEGKTVSKHLPTKSRVEARLSVLKERGAENDPDHWCFDLGFPPPEGLSKTIFTAALFDLHKAYDFHEFTGVDWTIIGCFDPAYGGGDRPAIRFAALGQIAGGKMGIEWMPPMLLYPDAASKVPIRYQLVGQCRKHCEGLKYRGRNYQCAPENFAFDATGDGGGICDIAQREWSNKIIRIQFGGAASEGQASLEDPRPANQIYKNKRAEMFFMTRSGVESGQIKGVDKETAEEICTLEFVDVRADMTSKLITIQNKKEYKLKFGKSCDLSDTGVMLTEVARLKGFRLSAVGHTVEQSKELEQLVEKTQSVYDDISYSDQSDPMDDPVFL